MAYGQYLDLSSEGQTLNLESLAALQARKTGDLITWSASFGAILMEADAVILEQYGALLGRAFQIQDDILDIEASSETLGKTTGKDTQSDKATYVSHLGLSGAKVLAKNVSQEAEETLSVYGEKASGLRALAKFVINRKN